MRFSWVLLAALSGSLALFSCRCDEELIAAPGDLFGTVCSIDTGATLAGVQVSIVDADGKSHEAQTDAAGTFLATDLAAGTATVTVNADGGRTVDVLIVSGEQAGYSDSACHPPVGPTPPFGHVDGRICNETAGAWVAGANVFIQTPEGALYVTGTDDNGAFLLENVAVGPQTLTIEKGAYFRQETVTIVDQETFHLTSPDTCELPPPPEGSGTIEGRVCAPDGQTWLADATVTVVRPDGTRAEDTTDTEGRYTLTGVPAGEQTVTVVKGSFSTSLTVTVTEGQTTTVPEDQCQLDPPDIRVAVVSGAWDRVEDVLDDVGVDPANITMYDGSSSAWVAELLGDYSVLSQYDIVFFNCGVYDFGFSFETQAIDNLRQYVSMGGSVYASDQAYDVVERAWPNSIDFYGSDNLSNQAQNGRETQDMTGQIVDPGLAGSLASTTIELHYPLLAWAVIQDVFANVTVYIRADAPLMDGTTLANVPHTVRFSGGQGRVLYTSFHQEANISEQMEHALRILMFEL
ncbi:MAG: carboxypeptidase regulatory-like domain-containing protein [Deltaproteobacteria bacterium]|nr:carboxypeptidase regulatory-like domain-containing protein [Deltaproteobacteria bacterium]